MYSISADRHIRMHRAQCFIRIRFSFTCWKTETKRFKVNRKLECMICIWCLTYVSVCISLGRRKKNGYTSQHKLYTCHTRQMCRIIRAMSKKCACAHRFDSHRFDFIINHVNRRIVLFRPKSSYG